MSLASVAKHNHAPLGTANLQISHDILDLFTRVLFFLFFFFPFPYSLKSGTPLANRRAAAAVAISVQISVCSSGYPKASSDELKSELWRHRRTACSSSEPLRFDIYFTDTEKMVQSLIRGRGHLLLLCSYMNGLTCTWIKINLWWSPLVIVNTPRATTNPPCRCTLGMHCTLNLKLKSFQSL